MGVAEEDDAAMQGQLAGLTMLSVRLAYQGDGLYAYRPRTTDGLYAYSPSDPAQACHFWGCTWS